jgi:hypothetical protein
MKHRRGWHQIPFSEEDADAVHTNANMAAHTAKDDGKVSWDLSEPGDR